MPSDGPIQLLDVKEEEPSVWLPFDGTSAVAPGGSEAARVVHAQRTLQAKPTADAIDAVASIADDTCIVLLGRIARLQPGLADVVLGALDEIDTPQASAVATAIRGGRRD